MKKATVYSLLAGAALFAAPMIASAAQDVVRDERGNVLTNTWENCVLTKWEVATDACAAAPAPAAAPVQAIAASKEELTVYFGFDSSKLTPAETTKLDRVASLIKASSSVESVSIIGFADEIGDTGYNSALSTRRATMVKNYLSSKGVNTAGVSLRGLGETNSKSQCEGTAGNERKACLWRDRRTELEINYKK
jgi:outer membrane protein OmpA-like peptidoglycan-associated protein